MELKKIISLIITNGGGDNWIVGTIGNTKAEIQQLTENEYEKLNNFFAPTEERIFNIKPIFNKSDINTNTELLKIQITILGKPYLQSKKINNCKIKNKFDKIQINFYEEEKEVKIIYDDCK